jgi:HD-GYP domain-containing protein (c-di-GMP phosphodiesterase class II)
VEEIKRTNGSKLDPRVAEVFLQVLKEISPTADSSATMVIQPAST